MNKNKFIVIALMLICFFGLKSNVFADNFMIYSIYIGNMTIDYKASSKITTAVLNCDGNQVTTFENVNNKRLNKSFDITKIISVGEHNCNLYYNVEGSDIAYKAFDDDVYVNITKPNLDFNFCKNYNKDAKSCKQNGCFFSNYGECSGYYDSYFPWDLNSTTNNGNNGNNGNSTGTNSSSTTTSNNASNSSSSNNTSIDEPDEEPFDSANFCKDISVGLKIAGYTIIIIKIITPLAIILMGSFDFYKAVSSGKPDDLKKQAIMLGNRVLVGLIIFFLPTILKTALNFISGESEYINCIDCLFDPNNSCK